MKPIYMWWYEKIKSPNAVLGIEYFSKDKETKCSNDDLRLDLNGYIDLYFPKEKKMNSIEFGIAFNKIIPNLKISRHNNDPRKYLIPSLLECRKNFTKNYGIEFTDEDEI